MLGESWLTPKAGSERVRGQRVPSYEPVLKLTPELSPPITIRLREFVRSGCPVGPFDTRTAAGHFVAGNDRLLSVAAPNSGAPAR